MTANDETPDLLPGLRKAAELLLGWREYHRAVSKNAAYLCGFDEAYVHIGAAAERVARGESPEATSRVAAQEEPDWAEGQLAGESHRNLRPFLYLHEVVDAITEVRLRALLSQSRGHFPNAKQGHLKVALALLEVAAGQLELALEERR